MNNELNYRTGEGAANPAPVPAGGEDADAAGQAAARAAAAAAAQGGAGGGAGATQGRAEAQAGHAGRPVRGNHRRDAGEADGLRERVVKCTGPEHPTQPR